MSTILKNKLQQLATLNIRKKEAEEAAEKVKKEFTALSFEVLKIFENTDIDKMSAHGFTFYIEERESVKVPKTPEQKKALFDYLEKLGIFDDIVSVNSKTLNKLFSEKSEEAAQAGNVDFKIPGLDDPTPSKSLRMRKS